MSSWLAVRNAKHHLFSPLTFSRVDLLAHQQGDCECLKCCHNYKVPAHDADAWTASLYCSATIIQSQSKNSWCAGGLPPKIRAASWNMSKSNFHWQAETIRGLFPTQRCPDGEAASCTKWERREKEVRNLRKCGQMHKLLRSQTPGGMTSIPAQLPRRTVVLWVGAMCFLVPLRGVLKPAYPEMDSQSTGIRRSFLANISN